MYPFFSSLNSLSYLPYRPMDFLMFNIRSSHWFSAYFIVKLQGSYEQKYRTQKEGTGAALLRMCNASGGYFQGSGTLNIRFILFMAFAYRSEFKFYSLDYKDFTAGTHPSSLLAMPHSKLIHVLTSQTCCSIIQLHGFLSFPLLEVCTPVSSTRRTLSPPFRIQCISNSVEIPSHRHILQAAFHPHPYTGTFSHIYQTVLWS